MYLRLLLVTTMVFTFTMNAQDTKAQPAASVPTPTPVPLLAPPQDQGLPYTRSARAMALAKIKDYIAVFPGSRYAYAKGFKVRLDNQNWRDEAVARYSTIFVPKDFVYTIALRHEQPAPAPSYLADRWVYNMGLRGSGSIMTPVIHSIQINDHPYVNLFTVARGFGLSVLQEPNGLMLIGDKPPTLAGVTPALMDSIVTLFDTPEKFADPDIATKYIPTLARQGKWTKHIKVTPEQLANAQRPGNQWPTAPQAEYDFSGFNAKLLGSKVPPPGVYPRILFSPQDVPMLAARIHSTKTGQMALLEMEYLFQKTWWNPATSDGQIFQKLARGEVAGLDWEVAPGTAPNSYPGTFKGQQPGIFNTHVQYVPECLTAMALYCLMTNDNAHGRMAAAAIANYYKLREPLLDELLATSDSEFGSSSVRPDGTLLTMEGNGAATHWRTVGGVIAHMNLGLALDFSGKWMTAAEQDTMRRIIAKATYGRRAYGQDAPVRFRDVNWVTWDLPQFLALTAIEGLEGFDREAWDSNRDTVRAFCDWGIDDAGVIYESNGKTAGGLQFQTLSMIALARRGDNLWGHPHWRKLLQAQAQMTSPSGNVVVNSGTQYVPFSQEHLSLQFVDEMQAFFPHDRNAAYLLNRAQDAPASSEYLRGWNSADFSPESYRAKLPGLQRLRLPSPTYPGFVHTLLYDSDYAPTTRADLHLPLDFNAPVHGVFSSRSDDTPDATWINIMVRPDHYLGAGHHHADAGMIHFSALGVDWFTQSPFSQVYDGRYYNLVQVDGHSEPENMPGIANGYQAAAHYLGATVNANGGFASADLTNSYSYRWLTQPPPVWSEAAQAMGWELDPSPAIQKIYAGTARYKMRPWWPNYTYSNFIVTSRAAFNPMQFVYRTAGLVRGPHPYGIVVDDLKKDGQDHLYQWAAMLNGGVWQAHIANLPPGQTVLAFRAPDSKAKPGATPRPLIEPQAGEPLLLVCALGHQTNDATLPAMQVSTEPGPADKKGVAQLYDRLVINQRRNEARFKVLLIPFRNGEPLPQIAYDEASQQATVTWPNGQDHLAFTTRPNAGAKVTITRAGHTILQSH